MLICFTYISFVCLQQVSFTYNRFSLIIHFNRAVISKHFHCTMTFILTMFINLFSLYFIKILNYTEFSIDSLNSIFLLSLAYHCLLFSRVQSSTTLGQKSNHHFLDCNSCFTGALRHFHFLQLGSIRSKISTNLKTEHQCHL